MRTITALYDNRQEAEAARSQLESALGLSGSSVQVIANEPEQAAQTSDSSRGFLAGLKDFFMAEEDRHAYSEGVRRGGYFLSAKVPEAQADQACELLDRTGAVDIDARQQQWRAEGWRSEAAHATQDTDQAIPIVDEEVRIGKREVSRGGVRIRSYVEETPVREQVNLREEHVEVERRTVDRPVASAEAESLFQERDIELTETAEEAVVQKQAVVREEVGLRKVVDERTEAVEETVRHTRVDVQDARGAAGSQTVRGMQDLSERSAIASEPATFESDLEDRSIAMDADDGSRVYETESERRERLAREGQGKQSF